MYRKLFAVLTVFAVLFSFAACCFTAGKNEPSTGNIVETTENAVTYVPSETLPLVETTAVSSSENVTEAPSTEAPVTEAPTTEAPTTEAAAEDVALWSTEKTVEFYRNAAVLTGTGVKSVQSIGLNDISVNNGQLGGVFSFVTPILSSFLSQSTTETDGITGNFTRLSPEDVSSAWAYAVSGGVAVELTLKEQSGNEDSDISDTHVAHGISVVEDLPSIMSQLNEKGLPIDISMENTVITYKDPVIKAVISDDGRIINGTWSCTVEISLSDYKFAGSKVDSTKVVLSNTITVNGGFNS